MWLRLSVGCLKLNPPVAANSATLIKSDHIYLGKDTGKTFSGDYLLMTFQIIILFSASVKISSHIIKRTNRLNLSIDQCLEENVINIKIAFDNKDCSFIHELDTNTAYTEFGGCLHNFTDIFALGKAAKVPSKYTICEQWMTEGLIKSSYSV